MQIRVLGPLGVRCGERLLQLGTPKQRAVLALLVVRANTVVGLADIVDELWGGHPPSSAAANVRLYTANLRRLLAAAGLSVLVRQRSGFMLTVEPGQLDLDRFRDLVRAGRMSMSDADFAAAEAHFESGLQLWRGRALADVPGGRTVAGWCAAVEEERLCAWEDRTEALLRLGRFDHAVSSARELAAMAPLRERNYAQLMRAHYAGGDVAAALAAFDAARRSLVERLGMEPGEELRRLQVAVLNRAVAGSGPANVLVGSRAAPVPRQLPADLPTFIGRAGYLHRLDAMLSAGGDRTPAVVISAIGGTAGVGKTALAVRWAHRVADRFSDGQLYVNLRGFDPTGRVMSPAEAMRGFLDALGVPAARIPADLDGQTGLYRSLLADKRMLVLLDNARHAEQVRPLLPGSPGCLTLVTSRHQLTGLVAAEGARPLTLDLLSTEEARELLARRLGADRAAAEAEAVDVIIDACARLPLALAIAAAYAEQTGFALATLAAELRHGRRRLDTLDAGDPATRVRAVFSWSYTALTPPAARLFRLLGLHPGPDLAAPAAASLAGCPLSEARRLLAELVRASLLTEHLPGRYTRHDLLHVYATERAEADEGDDDRRAALTRLLDHYTQTAYAADRLLRPSREPIVIPLPPPTAGTAVVHLGDFQQAMEWLTAERPVLLAAHRHAGSTGFDTHAWQLAWSLETFLHRGSYWHEEVQVWQTALDCARRLDDAAAQGLANRCLASALTLLGRHDSAHSHLKSGLDLYAQVGDLRGQAHVHRILGFVHRLQGRPAAALGHAYKALALFRTAGDQLGEASMLNSVGWYCSLLGDQAQAIHHCEQALVRLQRLGDDNLQAHTWDSLGHAHHRLGHHAQAIDCYHRAIALYSRLGVRYNRAGSLISLGDTCHAAADPEGARDAWQQAVDILTELNHPDADTVRSKLDGLDTAGAPRLGVP